jgi:Ca-activated chloride channel family protein
MGATSVSGRLPPEVVQRIVRQNFGRFRLCYESALRNNPSLKGRVAVRFLIGRDGKTSAVGDGGSDLPDGSVVTCVVRAFYGLQFPEPEGGVVTVVYPIMFSPGDEGGSSGWSPAPSPWRPSHWGFSSAPTAVHRAETSSFASDGEAALETLRRAVNEAPESRRKHESLIRGLLARGRFYEGLVRARQLADLDPDRPEAQELLAFAATVNGDRDLVLQAMGSLVELAARKASTHARAARAFEAAGDERRACAHWRSFAELSPNSVDAVYQALRCRARMLDDRDEALKDARSYEGPSPSTMKALIGDLEAGRLPRYEPDSARTVSALEAKVRCEGPSSSCPTVVVITPNGTVYSPFTPAAPPASPARGGLNAAAVPKVGDGTYRTFLIGGDPGADGEIEINALGSIKKLPILKGGARTVAATVVSGVSSTSFGR